jgi:hypothetical protein
MRRKSGLLSVCAAALVVLGCGYYKTTSRTAKDIKSVYVPFFANETTQPNLDIQVTELVVDFLVDDNTLKVVDEDRADAILQGRIVAFEFRPFAFDVQLNAQSYRVSIRVVASLYKRRTNEAVWENRDFTGVSTYFVEPLEGENDFDDAVNQAVFTITERILNLTTQDW